MQYINKTSIKDIENHDFYIFLEVINVKRTEKKGYYFSRVSKVKKSFKKCLYT